MENISITSIDGFAKKLCSITTESNMYAGSGINGYTIRVVPRATNATNSIYDGYAEGSYNNSAASYVLIPKGVYCLNYGGAQNVTNALSNGLTITFPFYACGLAKKQIRLHLT